MTIPKMLGRVEYVDFPKKNELLFSYKSLENTWWFTAERSENLLRYTVRKSAARLCVPGIRKL